MPERVLSMFESLMIVLVLGIVAPVGHLLQCREPLCWRMAIGYVLSNTVCAVSAFSLLALIPGLSPYAVVGMAAVIASIGQIGAIKLFEAYLKRKKVI